MLTRGGFVRRSVYNRSFGDDQSFNQSPEGRERERERERGENVHSSALNEEEESFRIRPAVCFARFARGVRECARSIGGFEYRRGAHIRFYKCGHICIRLWAYTSISKRCIPLAPTAHRPRGTTTSPTSPRYFSIAWLFYTSRVRDIARILWEQEPVKRDRTRPAL